MGPKALQIATPKNIPAVMSETEDDLHRWSASYFARATEGLVSLSELHGAGIR